MKIAYLLAAISTLAVAAPTMAADKDQKSDRDPPKEKKICRTETITGSLIARQRICKTQAEWDDLAANTKKQVDDLTRRENFGQPGSANGASSMPAVN